MRDVSRQPDVRRRPLQWLQRHDMPQRLLLGSDLQRALGLHLRDWRNGLRRMRHHEGGRLLDRRRVRVWRGSPLRCRAKMQRWALPVRRGILRHRLL